MPCNDESVAIMHRLGEFVSEVDYAALPGAVQSRVQLMLLDMLGITVAGARSAEVTAFRQTWRPPQGAATLIGAGSGASPDAAALLNGVAACVLELDEGHKRAQGHPAAHVIFGALAEAQASTAPVAGPKLMSAIVAGYEIAARFGAAITRRPELHTHGHWGTTGSGAAVARLMDLAPEQAAAAIDAAAGLSFITPWSVVLAGSFVRNLWAAGSNTAGLMGGRLAASGASRADGTALRTLGLVGSIDRHALTADLGDRWEVAGGYFKRHSSCSYTHPAADVIIRLRQEHRFTTTDVERICIKTHRLSMPLVPLDASTRLAAMFSMPYVVAVAATLGRVDPDSFTTERRTDPTILNLATRVEVVDDPLLDSRLPDERGVEVSIRLYDGSELIASQPNPIGDADYHPFDHDRVLNQISVLIGAQDADRIAAIVSELPTARDVSKTLSRLP